MPNWIRTLEEAWRLAESTHPTSTEGIAMEGLDVAVPGGRLSAGVDGSGYRHLLIPIHADTQVAGLFDGRSIQLRKRPLVVDETTTTFASLTCTQGELFPEFTTLVAEVIKAVVNSPSDDVLGSVRAVLMDWRALLQGLGGGGLDRNAVTGLYGELLLLEQVVRLDPRRRTDGWTGADRARHDFQRGGIVVETKTSAARRGRVFTVHGLDQLVPPPSAELYLSWMRIEAGVERGDSLRALVDRLLDLASDVAQLRRKLEAAGYRPQSEDDYIQPTFTLIEHDIYSVGGTFPRLTAQSFVGGRLPRGVTTLDYEVDLSNETSLREDEGTAVLRQLAGV